MVIVLLIEVLIELCCEQKMSDWVGHSLHRDLSTRLTWYWCTQVTSVHCNKH
jgi:hypothetical protein